MGAFSDSAPQYRGRSNDVGVSVLGVIEEPAVVHRDDPGTARWGYDIVGAMDHIGMAEPSIDGNGAQSPCAHRHRCWHREATLGRSKARPSADEVSVEVELVAPRQRIDGPGHGIADTCSTAVGRPYVDRHSYHAEAERICAS